MAENGLVLIVDDIPDVRDMYAQFLDLCGFRVALTCDGLEALQATTSELPSVILMDLNMPRMDGWEAIRRLKSNPRTTDVPILALSAQAFGDEPQRARDAGADVCLTKPCSPSQVARVVRTLLKKNTAADLDC
jgi:two-component system cell cycle response regulator DivK